MKLLKVESSLNSSFRYGDQVLFSCADSNTMKDRLCLKNSGKQAEEFAARGPWKCVYAATETSAGCSDSAFGFCSGYRETAQNWRQSLCDQTARQGFPGKCVWRWENGSLTQKSVSPAPQMSRLKKHRQMTARFVRVDEQRIQAPED